MTKYAFWSETLSPGKLPVYEAGGVDVVLFDKHGIVRLTNRRRLVVPEFEVVANSWRSMIRQIVDMIRRLIVHVESEGLRPGTVVLPNRGVVRLKSTETSLLAVNVGLAHMSDVKLEEENSGEFCFPSPMGLGDLDHIENLLKIRDVMAS